MSADTVHPIPLLNASLRLVAVPTVVGCSRLFVTHHLTNWGYKEQIETATLIMSELVTNAVKASGIIDPDVKPWHIKPEHVIGIQMRALGAGLYIEVWDRTDDAPARKNPDLQAESGRGLVLVEALTECWGVYRPRAGGKIVWAELPLDAPVEQPSGEWHRPLLLPSDLRARRGPVEQQARMSLYERLMDTTVTASVARRVKDVT
ncbi:serine/threonine protein kinase [Streptomyces geranii]|uniref:serine/threonine protein kinase n=1 Tax=Streptomyces geranii TaxID=2058923 RepID=UPI000D039F4B|nr:serine/threonine protein kinase [Streptomyces geranii]